MRLPQALCALGVLALTLGVAARAGAYCLTRTCDPSTGMCELDGNCVTSGKVLHWPNSCVSFAVQKDGSTKLGIDAPTLDQVAVQAFARWEQADCGNGTHPGIKIWDDGLVDCAKPEYNKAQPNANVITFHDAPWTYTNTVDMVALTTVFFNGDSGEIYDANIEINSNQFDLAVTDPVGAELDLNAVLTHECGHFLGLSHSDIGTATMYRQYDPDMTTLDPDDETAICLSLPPGRSVASDSCTPRHGFSSECSTPDTGCCASAVGSSASRSQALGLLAFGLGLCAWRGRRFYFRRSERALRR